MALRATGIDLTEETLTLAVCVRIERQDGTVLGFTSHDVDLTVDGETYVAAGFDPSALRAQVGPSVDNMEIIGLLDSAAILEADLQAGHYDGAEIRVFIVDWNNTALAPLKLMKGTLGEVRHGEGRFVAEIRSLGQRLNQNVGDLVSPLCRVTQFANAQCGLTASSYQEAATVSEVIGWDAIKVTGPSAASGRYDYGTLLFDTGDNAGVTREIRAHTNYGAYAIVWIQERFPETVQVGDTATLSAGCDRRFETCRDKFSNAANFRGEPHVPPSDYLTQRGAQ